MACRNEYRTPLTNPRYADICAEAKQWGFEDHEDCYRALRETLAWMAYPDEPPISAAARKQLTRTRRELEKAIEHIGDREPARSALQAAAHAITPPRGRPPVRDDFKEMAWEIRRFWQDHRPDDSDGIHFPEQGAVEPLNDHCRFQVMLLGLYARLDVHECRSLLRRHLRGMTSDLSRLSELSDSDES